MTILIFCGPTVEAWGPESLKAGVGGSESAAVHMAWRLSLLGHAVTVAREGGFEWDGPVKYVPYHKGLEAHYDVLVSWRTPGHILALKANTSWDKAYLWLHDCVPQVEVLPFVYHYDRIFALSKFHRSLYPDIHDDRFFITRNGVDLALWKGREPVERDPYALVYASAYDRGLVVLLENWTRLKLWFPDLTLNVMYGWSTLEKLATGATDYRIFHDYVENLLDQEGIIHHGRVGHAEVASIMASSGILAYPCTFPEVSCITAMQAQCLGAVPVVIPTAALEETVLEGFKTKDVSPQWRTVHPAVEEQYVTLLAETIASGAADSVRPRMEAEARSRFPWSAVALEWDRLFSGTPGDLAGPVPAVAD